MMDSVIVIIIIISIVIVVTIIISINAVSVDVHSILVGHMCIIFTVRNACNFKFGFSKLRLKS